MSTLSAKKLENYLKEYQVHLDYWVPDDGEGNELLGCREILAHHHSSLSGKQKNNLKQLDIKAQQLLADYKGTDYFDILMLEKTVAIAKQ